MKMMHVVVTIACLLGVVVAAPRTMAQSGASDPMPAATLDQLLAPIALYPDALIIQIMECASSPYQVNQVSAWLDQHQDLKGTALQDAASKEGFDVSFVAIVLFPEVVKMMADKPDWTRDLGRAFTTDRDGVLDSIQRLRAEAQRAGNLKSTSQQEVSTVNSDGQQVIVIQPTNPQVVYVPVYDPQVVYTEPASNSGNAVAAGLIGFAAGVIVGAAADNDHDHYYYSCGGWGYRGPALCSGGWNNYYNHREDMNKDYYKHRENMANDYYDHRENMAGQRGDNQSNRQDARNDNLSSRQDTRTANRDTASQNQSSRQATRSDTRDTASQNRGANQSSRQNAAQQRGGATGSRGTYQGASGTRTRQSGTQSGAFSGYQRGSTERASSARGRSSMNRSSGASRGGRSAGGRSAGGRSRGGGGRRR